MRWNGQRGLIEQYLSLRQRRYRARRFSAPVDELIPLRESSFSSVRQQQSRIVAGALAAIFHDGGSQAVGVIGAIAPEIGMLRVARLALT